MSWTPTHVQVTVHRARNLLPKGKAGTNDAYVTIQLAKEKYQTSIKERSDNPEWHEECDLLLTDMTGHVVLNAFHRSFLGLDDFLGHVSIPLDQFQIYERPRSRWYSLKSKPGKKDEKYRGEIEVKVTFIVQSKSESQTGLRMGNRTGSIKHLATTMGEKLKIPNRSNSFRSDKSGSTSSTGSGSEVKKTLSGSLEALHIKSPLHKKIKKMPSLEDYYKAPTPQKDFPGSLAENEEPESPRTGFDSTGNGGRPLEEPLSQSEKQESAGEIIISYPPTIITPDNANNSSVEGSLHDAPLTHDDGSHLSPIEHTSWRGRADGDDSSIATDNISMATTHSDADSVSTDGDSLPVIRMTRLPAEDDDVTAADAPRLKRARSDADARFVERRRPVSMVEGSTETPLLSDTRELARSLGKLNEDDARWVGENGTGGAGSAERLARAGSGSALPESIPEETGEVDEKAERMDRIRKLRDRDNNRRHTLQDELPRVAAHELQRSVGEQLQNNSKENALPKEVLDDYKHLTREDLIKMVHMQRQQLYRKDNQIKDLEGYIDNLLVKVMEDDPRILQHPVKVMENTPRILQNPYKTPRYLPSTKSITPATKTIVQTNNKKNNKHHSNPFKKIQAALK